MFQNTKTFLLIVFGLSGAAALMYEIIWARELVLVFGATTYAISTVLAVFFAGLALGSFLFGKLVDTYKNPLLFYAALEIGIGVYAFLTPWIFKLILALQISFGGLFGLEGLLEWSFLRFALSFFALIIPATLIGGTLPVIIKYFSNNLERFGNVTAKLYSVNTFGAVLGTILAGFFLVALLGVNGTLYLTATISLFIGVATLYLWYQEKAPMPEVAQEKVIVSGQRDMRLWLVLGGFFLSGFAAIALEVLWTRALILTIGISTYAFSLILITFLLGIALGSLFISRFVDKINAWNAFGFLEILRGVSVIILIPLFGILPLWYLALIEKFGWSFGAGISASFLLTIVVLLVPTILMGMTFPVVAKIVTREFKELGASVGRAYFFNTLGGVGGALAAGFLLIPFMGVQNSIVFTAALYLLVGSVLILYSATATIRLKGAVVIIAMVFLVAGLALPDWNRFILQSSVFTKAPRYLERSSEELKDDLTKRELLFYKEGLSSLIGVIQENNQKTLTVNGKVQSGSETDKEPQLLLGHLPMLLHPYPKSVLVIGLGSGMTLGAIEQYEGLERVTVIEIEPEVIEAASYFSDVNNDALNDPRLKVVIGDGRNFLLTITETFDVISSEPSNPWIKGLANLYTKEFFELARKRLNNGGFMVQWMQINALSNEDMRSFIATFQSVFPAVSVWEALGSVILIGGQEEVSPFDKERISKHFATESVAQDLARIGVENVPALLSHFVVSGTAVNEFTAGFPLHTDNRPFLEFSSPKIFYQSEEKFLENLAFFNSLRVPAETFVSNEAEEKEIQNYFDFRTHLIKGELASRTSNFEAAVIAYEAAMTLFPLPTSSTLRLKLSYAVLANRFESKEKYTEAEKYYRKLTEKFPEDEAGWLDLGAFYANQKTFGAAEQAFLESLELNPDDPEAHVYLGALYRTTYRTDKAIFEFSVAIDLDPSNFNAWNNLGYTYEEMGDNIAAIAAYEKALGIDPTQTEIREVLGNLRRR